MMTVFYFFLGLVMLYLGGEGLVRSASAIGIRLHMSPLVAGLTIIAFATSAPELAISVGAALKDLPGLAVGNVIGSNICNLALILGVTAFVRPAPIRQSLVRRDVLVMSITTLLVPGLLLDGNLSRLEGALLFTSMAAYVVLTVWHARATRHERSRDEHKVPLLSESIVVNLLLAAGALSLLVFGSDFFVEASVEIATRIGVPAAVVGLSAAALGSSLPELTASIIAARHGHPEMAAGNLIGSNIFNLLLILGTTSMIRPLSNGAVTTVDLGAMIFVTALALAIMLSRARVARWEATVLLSSYVLYIGYLFSR